MGKDSDLADMGRYLREQKKMRGERNLATADPTGWTQHTEHHWSRDLNGQRLDYWPSRNKFMFNGKVMTGDVVGFIRRRTQKSE